MALRSGLFPGSLTRLRSLALLALATACGGGEHVEIAWTGADTGQATLNANAMRCAGEIQLFATSGDTGVAMLLRANSKLRIGLDLPVLSPAEARETQPAAAIAARWLDSARVDGYRGVKGTVRLTADKKTVDGEFRAQLRREGDQAEVIMTGRIRHVTIGVCEDSAGS